MFRGAVCPACIRHGAGSYLGGVTMKRGGEGGEVWGARAVSPTFCWVGAISAWIFGRLIAFLSFYFTARHVTAPQGMHGSQGLFA